MELYKLCFLKESLFRFIIVSLFYAKESMLKYKRV